MMKLRHSGYTMVELLVAMVLGIFLIGGAISYFVGSKGANTTRQNLSEIEELGRNALFEIRRVVQHAGYRGLDQVKLDNHMIATAITAGTCAGNGVEATGTNVADSSDIYLIAEGASGANDAISVSYIGDDGFNQDCSGLSLPVDCQAANVIDENASSIVSAFYIADHNSDPHLYCSSSLLKDPVPLIPGVEKLQFNYGVDNDSNGVVDSYQNAGSITDWNKVIAVRVGLIVRSLQPVKAQAETQSIALLDQVINFPADRYMREVFETSIRLKNVGI